MRKIIISVLGQDRPGIIAAVSKILFDQDSNIENVSQTILQSEFSGIFIASVPKQSSLDELHVCLKEGLAPMNLYVHVKSLEQAQNTYSPGQSEPFIITTKGPDRKGLVAKITEIIARHKVNVSNLQALFKGGDDPNKNIMIYEVDIPPQTDPQKLYAELREKADELGLMISIQHRNIFEAINRV